MSYGTLPPGRKTSPASEAVVGVSTMRVGDESTRTVASPLMAAMASGAAVVGTR